MTKPREFWIKIKSLNVDGVIKVPLYLASIAPVEDATHVREVLDEKSRETVHSTQSTTYYIPWGTVWAEYEKEFPKMFDKLSYQFDARIFLQELVERALKGEL